MTEHNIQKEYYVCIEAGNAPFRIDLREVWRYRDLIWLFTRKSLIRRYKQTILGPLWLILSPLITGITYTIIFGTVAGIDTVGLPKILFYLAGHGLWAYFSGVFSRCSGTFSGNAYLFGKVYFPRLTVPISNILLSSIEFLVQFAIVILLCIYFIFQGYTFPVGTWLMIPLILLWLGVLAMGFGLIVSSLTAKYRDLHILVNFGVRLWMYATPVVYPLSTISGGTLRKFILVNPVTAPTEIFRHFVLGPGGVPLWSLVLSLTVTVLAAVGGILIFNRVEKTFMDTI